MLFAADVRGFAAIYYWYPKMTGRMMREGLGKASFWLMLVGFFVMLAPKYLLGLHGMPRRIAEYSAIGRLDRAQPIFDGRRVADLRRVAITLVNFYVSWRKPEFAARTRGTARPLEWATTSPPPHHNFDSIPPIRSERPVWDFNHPDHPTINRSSSSFQASPPKERAEARS